MAVFPQLEVCTQLVNKYNDRMPAVSAKRSKGDNPTGNLSPFFIGYLINTVVTYGFMIILEKSSDETLSRCPVF